MLTAKAWILALSLLMFLSGGVSGFLFAAHRRPPESDHLMAAYEARLVREFALDGQRAQDLGFVLDRYEKDLAALEARLLRERMEDDLVALGNRTVAQIRRWVIPPERIEEFDALGRGGAVPSPAHPQ